MDLFRYIDANYADSDYVEDITEIGYSPGPSYEEGQEDYFEAGYIDAEYFQNPNSYFEEGYIDEDYLRAPLTNGYFEEGYIDEAYFERIVSASSSSLAYFNISAVGEIVEPAGEVKEFEADFIAEFALAADADKFIDAEITAVSEFTLSSAAEKILDSNADLVTEFVQTAGAGKITDTTTVIQVTATVSASIVNILGTDMFAFSDAALAAEVQRIRDVNIETSAVFDIGIDYVRFRDQQADFNSIFDAIINGLRSRDFNIDAEAAFSLGADAEVIAGLSSALVSEFVTGHQENGLFVPGIRPNAIFDIEGNDTLLANSTVTSDGDRIRTVSADAVSEFTAAISASKSTDTSAQLSSVFDNATMVAIISDIQLELFNTVTVTADVNVIRDAESDQISEFAIAIDGKRIRTGNLTAQATTSLNAQASVTKSVSADLLALGFVLTEGSFIQVNQYVYRIPAETRMHKIRSETRIHEIRR